MLGSLRLISSHTLFTASTDGAVPVIRSLPSCRVMLEILPLMPHVGHLYARILPEGREAIERAGRFVQAMLPGD